MTVKNLAQIYFKSKLYTFVVVEKLFREDGNVKDADLVAGAVRTVPDVVTPVPVGAVGVLLRMPLRLVARLHVLDHMQLRVVGLELLHIRLRRDLAVRCVRSRLLQGKTNISERLGPCPMNRSGVL